MKKLYFVLITLIGVLSFVEAQSQPMPEVPLIRRKFHDDIDLSQKDITTLVAKKDKTNLRFRYLVVAKVDSLQNDIEQDNNLDSNIKIKYLRGLNDALKSYAAYLRTGRTTMEMFEVFIDTYVKATALEKNNQSIVPVFKDCDLIIGGMLVNCFTFSKNSGLQQSKDMLIGRECMLHPEKILPTLLIYPDLYEADKLITKAAYYNQEIFYNYAGASNALGSRIKKVTDPLVQIISKMARMKTGRQYFPFLDDLYSGRKNFAGIDSVMSDSIKYFKLLVATEIEYADRKRRKDTPLVMSTLTAKLRQNAVDVFINEINGLHDAPDAVRFKKIEKLSPEELYYLAVLGEEEIYTSSYTRGVYPLIFKKLKPSRGDTLLLRVYFDHFKKWIKMAANYNMLGDFLKTMEKENAQALMTAFVKGLDKTSDLEDAVDVANSYAGIGDTGLQKLILAQVQRSYKEAEAAKNKRGVDIYGILNTLFLSMDTLNKIDVSAILGIPPVYMMPMKQLQDDSGKIVIQQFFYGDKDGQNIFNAFVNSFSNSNWKIIRTNDWVEVVSVKGKPIRIFSNRPLDETKGLDEIAQNNLNEYLDTNKLYPTMVIHRGHSYYLNSTINQLSSSAKVVLLGSCGGYQSLQKVLKICPYAQIISSKQIGSGTINQPMISTLIENLRQGKDLVWPALWGNFTKIFKGNELFADYVPPYKNLGAVFIMAYQKKTENAPQLTTNN